MSVPVGILTPAMPFAYYNRLNKRQKAIYRASDKVPRLKLPAPETAREHAEALAKALALTGPAADLRRAVARTATRLASEVCSQLGVDPVRIKILARRPRSAESELHGLYTWEEGHRAEISLWMRTAQRKQVVAYRTFLRTLLHELCHHLDYHLLELDDSFHTEGFFQRESSLARQLLGEAAGAKPKKPKGAAAKRDKKRPAKRAKAEPAERPTKQGKSGQIDLPF